MLFKFLSKKKKVKLQEQSEQKFDMNNWMNLTKEERLEIDFNEKNTIMRKKKALLKSIREEYIKMKNEK
ncbi:possible Hantavirus glycoprotein G2 [Prochlorococcus marinus str. NATL1A]|uniref:Possible Hantavirus glycoprotein G2 n=1 Tax=Prochlorococcus marinus (strain NATL1A) TaxID=167555 RepID=A2C184_PROM1|nr:possible Hantavirus glycoprotein G2 [Prochlorococcus marinus str. NATL1A]